MRKLIEQGTAPKARRKVLSSPLAEPVRCSIFEETSKKVFAALRKLETWTGELKPQLRLLSVELAYSHTREILDLKIEVAVRLTEAAKIQDLKSQEDRVKEIEAWTNMAIAMAKDSQEARIALLRLGKTHLPSMPLPVDLVELPKGVRMSSVLKTTANMTVLRVFGPLCSEFVDGISLLNRSSQHLEHPNKIMEDLKARRCSLFVVKNEMGWVVAAALKQGENVQTVVRSEYKEAHVSAFLRAAIETELRSN